MTKYRIDDLSKGIFAEPITTEAKSPKEAVEKVLMRKVQRDYTGIFGSIVVYGNGRSFVYEVIGETESEIQG